MSAIKVFMSVVALAGLTAAFAQQPGAPPKQPGAGLDEVLAKALAHSPDIQIAEAKLREAEAELRRARLSLMQKVIDTQATIEAQRRQVGIAEAGLGRVAKLAKAGTISQDELQIQEKMLLDAKSVLARCEATLNALVGSVPERFSKLVDAKEERIFRMVGEAEAEPDIAKPPHPAMADKIRTALDSRSKPTQFKAAPLSDVIEMLGKTSGGVPFVAAIGDKKDEPITMSISADVPLGGHLQALQDLAPGLQVFARDYGLFFTFSSGPDRGMTMEDFWHGDKRKKPSPMP